MKILYTEGSLINAGQRLLIRAIGVNNVLDSEEKREFNKAFPEVADLIKKIYDSSTTVVFKNKAEPPRLGDIIWAETAGGKLIANCVVFDENDNLDLNAVKTSLKSVNTRIGIIGDEMVASNLFGADQKDAETQRNSLNRWNSVVSIIEQSLEDVQLVVYIPTKERLVTVLEGLPGSRRFQRITSRPIIRFKRYGKSDK